MYNFSLVSVKLCIYFKKLTNFDVIGFLFINNLKLIKLIKRWRLLI